MARLALALLLAAAALPAGHARAAEGFALQLLAPTAPADRFFAAPGADVAGHLAPAAALVLDYARDGLALQQGGEVIPNGRLLQDQVLLHLGLALPLWDRLLVDAALPFAAWQRGEMPFGGQAAVSATALGDVRLGARAVLWRMSRLALGAGLQAWLPTGDRAAYVSDGAARVEPRLSADGRAGSYVYAGSLGWLLRDEVDVTYHVTGSAVTATAAVGRLFLRDALQIGVEALGRHQYGGHAGTAVEGLLGARWRTGGLTLGGALGTQLTSDAPGSAPLRILVQLAWAPGEGPARARAWVEPERELSAPAEAPQAELVAATSPGPAEPAPPAPGVPSDPAPAAPAAVAASAAAPGEALPSMVGSSVAFGFGTAEIWATSLPALASIADALRANPALHVRLEGHSDAIGAAAVNQALSARRAEAVRRWLVRQGVAADRLEVEGFGASRPVAPSDTIANCRKNRRVEAVPVR